MAEFVMKDLTRRHKMEDTFYIASAATSNEELGNAVHPGTRKKLAQHNINVSGKHAIRLTLTDYDMYDYIIGMDKRNVQNILRIIGTDDKHKVFRLLDITERPRDIADPWYTGDFDVTYEDIKEGCETLYYNLINKGGF